MANASMIFGERFSSWISFAILCFSIEVIKPDKMPKMSRIRMDSGRRMMVRVMKTVNM